MAHYNVVIETHTRPDSRLYRADVVDGPNYTLGTYMGIGATAELAFEDAKAHLQRCFKGHTFNFLHVQSDTERDDG